MNRAEYIEKLLTSYESYYNVHHIEDDTPLTARCDFHMENNRYVLNKRNVLWSTNSHEYCYVFSIPHLTDDLYHTFQKEVYEKGMALIKAGQEEHLATNLTLLIVCDTCDAEAAKALKHCRLHEDFRFGLDGWMNFRTAMVCMSNEKVTANLSGHDLKKLLRQFFKQNTRTVFSQI